MLLLVGIDNSDYSLEYAFDLKDRLGRNVQIKGYQGSNYFGSNELMTKKVRE